MSDWEMEIDKSDGQDRIPITVLTGALGAGKTTLLKFVLQAKHGYRIAVIQNEFSEEMGIESPLFTDSSGEPVKDIYELPNGCLCCSAKDGLLGTIDALLERRQDFDYVLVEATGIADPEAICEIFWVDEGLSSRVFLDGVVTLVDGKNAMSSLASISRNPGETGDGMGLEAEVSKQIACGDVLILNKIDLTTEAHRKLISERLAAMNPAALLLESTQAQIPLETILGIRAFSREKLESTLSGLHGHPGHGGGHEGHAGHGHAGHGHSHEHGQDDCAECSHNVAPTDGYVAVAGHGIDSCLLRCSKDECYDPSKVETWLADVLWEGTAGNVFRCKGLFRGRREEDVGEECPGEMHVDGKEATVPYALQGVGRIFELDEAPSVKLDQGKLLFIGRGLRRDLLEAGLRGCLSH